MEKRTFFLRRFNQDQTDVAPHDFQRYTGKARPAAHVYDNALKRKIERDKSRQRIHKMLADNLMGICNACEIRRSIPREQMRKVNQELSGLLVGETDAQPLGGCDKELAKGTLMFHVEQLRETAQEVKGFLALVCAFQAQRATPKWQQE